jgi:hypothetical protein
MVNLSLPMKDFSSPLKNIDAATLDRHAQPFAEEIPAVQSIA